MDQRSRGLAEISDALVVRWHCATSQLTGDDPGGLFVEECEKFVLLDRSSKVAAKLVADVFRFTQPLAVGEEIVRVSVAIAQIFVQCAVDLVGPALADDADYRAPPAILSR